MDMTWLMTSAEFDQLAVKNKTGKNIGLRSLREENATFLRFRHIDGQCRCQCRERKVKARHTRGLDQTAVAFR